MRCCVLAKTAFAGPVHVCEHASNSVLHKLKRIQIKAFLFIQRHQRSEQLGPWPHNWSWCRTFSCFIRPLSEGTLVHHSRSKCVQSPLPIRRSILLKLMWGRHTSKPLNLSSLSSALTFMRLCNAGKWPSLGQHVLCLYANAMLRWLYEGPFKRPISFGGTGPCLMKVFYILYI